MRTIPLLLILLIAAPVLADEPKVQRGIPYAEPKNERQMLDVYAPTTGKNLPVVVWIHGGGWHSGDKKDVMQKPQAFTDKGFVLVSINYRLQVWTDPQLSPGVTIKQIAEDVARAIHWTHDHAKDFGGDPNTIIVMGHSAGAQLAALVCTDDRYLKAEKLSLSIIKGCVPVDGDTYDLPMRIATVHKKGDKKLAERDKQRFGDEAMQKDLSSITHVAKGKHIPPFLILHVADHPETRGQSQRLLQVLEAAGISARAYPAEGKNHTTINVDLGLADDPATREIFAFLSAVLKKADKDAKKRTLQHFQKTLDKTFTPTKAVAAFGEPDRKLGSGLIIYEYNLDDGTKIRLAFPGFVPIESAQHVQKDGKFEVIPVK